MGIAGEVAIVGIGHTVQGELPGRTAEDNAVDAVRSALGDAGITKTDLTGLITCKSVQGRGTDLSIGKLLGINPAYAQTLDYGTCNFSMHLAVGAIMTGLAETIALCYGANSRTGKFEFGEVPISADLATASGLVHIAGPAALALQRHKHLYGTTDEQFGWLAVGQREWATMNPHAIFRQPMSMDEYLATPYLVEPLRRPDLTMISDGGVALVVTTADRARDLPGTPVYISGISEQSGLRGDHNRDNLLRPWLRQSASALWKATGLHPSDVDVLFIQDPTAVWSLQMLEYYGFCGIGEGGSFLAEGHTRPGGDLPLNTHGGQLSESYSWGWMHMVEAVRQLRGEAGERQVDHPQIALHCSSQGFVKAASTLLSRDPEVGR